jgi:transposase
MNQGKMVFSQIMEFANQDIFKNIVSHYDGNYKTKDFSSWKHFLCLSFGQLTHRESMSDAMLCLKLNSSKLFHLGIGKAFDKSTVSRANENRDWRIFQDFGMKLIDQAKELYKGSTQLTFDLKGDIFAFDSTTIDLCLDIFWWATFRSTKSAIKIHTLLDCKTSIPEFIFISEGDVHDVNVLDVIPIQKGSYYIMDKAYVDFFRLYLIHMRKAFFVVRAKENLQFICVKSNPVNKKANILCDQEIRLNGFYSSKNYPENLRRIKFYDSEFDRTFVFLTNNKKVNAQTVAKLYKSRWYVELFFKWIKQHLKIKSFWGQNENAVRSQIWVAISSYVIVAIAKKKLNIPNSLYEILQYISIAPFEKTPLSETFTNENWQEIKEQNRIQLKMF